MNNKSKAWIWVPVLIVVVAFLFALVHNSNNKPAQRAAGDKFVVFYLHENSENGVITEAQLTLLNELRFPKEFTEEHSVSANLGVNMQVTGDLRTISLKPRSGKEFTPEHLKLSYRQIQKFFGGILVRSDYIPRENSDDRIIGPWFYSLTEHELILRAEIIDIEQGIDVEASIQDLAKLSSGSVWVEVIKKTGIGKKRSSEIQSFNIFKNPDTGKFLVSSQEWSRCNGSTGSPPNYWGTYFAPYASYLKGLEIGGYVGDLEVTRQIDDQAKKAGEQGVTRVFCTN